MDADANKEWDAHTHPTFAGGIGAGLLNDPLKVGAGNELENLTVDPRHQLNFCYYQSGSPFEYDLVRFLYKKRELEIAK
jgi:hypothetical protein